MHAANIISALKRAYSIKDKRDLFNYDNKGKRNGYDNHERPINTSNNSLPFERDTRSENIFNNDDNGQRNGYDNHERPTNYSNNFLPSERKLINKRFQSIANYYQPYKEKGNSINEIKQHVIQKLQNVLLSDDY